MKLRPLGLLLLLLLLALPPASYLAAYRTWDTCEWLRLDATAIAWREAGLPEDELPGEDPRYAWAFARWQQLIEPYHSDGRCLQGWARLKLGLAPPVVQ